jgi:hypothetical protein
MVDLNQQNVFLVSIRIDHRSAATSVHAWLVHSISKETDRQVYRTRKLWENSEILTRKIDGENLDEQKTIGRVIQLGVFHCAWLHSV